MKVFQTGPYFLSLLLLPLLTVSSSSSRSIAISPSCPTQYKLLKLDESEMTILLDENKSYCRQINRLRRRVSDKMEDPANILKLPHITPMAKDGKYWANIEFELKPNKGKYPRKLFLEMIMYRRSKSEAGVIDDYMDKKCLKLKLLGELKGDPYMLQRPLMFSFACIELIEEPGQYYLLATQLWSDQRHSNRCRNKRDIASTSSSCGIQCSKETMYPLSLEGENEYQLCTCADKMAFRITSDIQGKQALINLVGLPHLIGDLTAKIINISEKIVYRNVTNTKSIRDGKLQLHIPELSPGNYTIYIDAECRLRKTGYTRIHETRNNIISQCHQDDIHAQASFDILEMPTGRVPYTELFVIMSAIIVVAFVTCIVFVTIKHRKRKSREMEKQNQDIDMKGLTYDRPSMSQDFPDNRRTMECDTDIDEEIPCLKQYDAVKEIETVDHPSYNKHELNVEKPEMNKAYKINKMNTEGKPTYAIIVSHPDNTEHVNSVNRLFEYSKTKEINLISSSEENWRDLAENAIGLYQHILVVISDGLNQLCRSYKSGGIENEQFQKLISTRRQEYVPCVLMDKIRIKVHENPNRSDFCLHLVTICDNERESKRLVREFYIEHDYLKRYNKIEIYFLSCSNVIDSNDMERVVTNLHS